MKQWPSLKDKSIEPFAMCFLRILIIGICWLRICFVISGRI
ncbi:unnamed protein product [Brassica oleracea var. botrytis]|uniref:(rape) hypothetical protein n=1 Tax=Brassica napus TaxID=3708 RepID=A0A816JWZ6_BRANA|nr:unnamed protein product [Brassica napus]